MLVVTKDPLFSKTSPQHNSTLNVLRDSLKVQKVHYDEITTAFLDRVDFNKYNIVICVGGDGTLLRTSYFIEDQLVLGVNSDNANSIGYLLNVSKDNLKQAIAKIAKNKYSVEKRTRINTYKNGKFIGGALNEIFVGHKDPYKVLEYFIGIDGRKSIHMKSSGTLVSTGSGSTGWMHSAGGQDFDKTSRKLEYLVREPLQKYLTPLSHQMVFVKKQELYLLVKEF